MVRFFSRRGNGSSSQEGRDASNGNGNGGNNGRARHVYPGQRTVVRGNAVPRTVAGTPVNASPALGGGGAQVMIRSAPAGSAPAAVLGAATYPGHMQPGGAAHGGQAGVGQAG
eukprot:CAMPEP_0113577382 /NCGR_PEP_ID=MMETSP0015_2-20120614/28845_1 /TAXON_ID=2838 /ORGANISM="Odontella" /LENGTH=112 /DNA_ID=CAMNT_0000480971 /DNA_START=777 /DNA_END=1111 /DNA_ORIENTATION=- /assembly_acc=CAM_ASM_000160